MIKVINNRKHYKTQGKNRNDNVKIMSYKQIACGNSKPNPIIEYIIKKDNS